MSRSSLLRLEIGIHTLQTKLRHLQNDQEQTRLTHVQRSVKEESAMRDLEVVIGDLQKGQKRLVANLEQPSVQLNLTKAQSIVKDVQSTAGEVIQPRSIYISTSILQTRCCDGCVCVCHQRQTKKTPKFLTSFFGTLFIGYAGLPRVTQSCDVQSCVQRTSPTMTITYLFPVWLLTRAFFLALKLSSCNGPQLYLRFPRIVSINSRIFIFAMSGDVDAMKQLLQKRIGSLFDSDSVAIFSPLMVSDPSS